MYGRLIIPVGAHDGSVLVGWNVRNLKALPVEREGPGHVGRSYGFGVAGFGAAGFGAGLEVVVEAAPAFTG